MYNINVMRSDVKAKLGNNEQITQEDVTAAMEVAQRSQHHNDRILYVNVKHAYKAQQEHNEE
ncbi:hypothetical protein [Bacillus cereus]|uniref:hypothetical protein n=1 Tax=Bacillus cereus TaxID=1396 RepID=UPI000936D41A|nr:hypothetical protein [Bacillus cereus]OKA23405.1 hypothetical protein BJR05_23545 [Bacillus cereus]